MKRSFSMLGLVLVLVGGFAVTAMGVNKVEIESKTVSPGATGVQIGVFITNEDSLQAIVLPLEIRKGDGDAFITSSMSWSLNFIDPGRIWTSGLSPLNGAQSFTLVLDTADALPEEACSGPVGRTYKNSAGSAGTGFFSAPSALLYTAVGTLSPLDPGTDVVPSLTMTFDVGTAQGEFEIDTCCTTPANHLEFLDWVTGQPLTNVEFVRGNVIVGVTGVKAVTGDGSRPKSFALSQNYPNPFNAGTIIPFEVAHRSRVKVEIYNILGRKIATVADDEFDQGHYQADWNGTDKNGTPVATGVYFYRLVSDENVTTRKMVLVK